jgi:hypothetical protein
MDSEELGILALAGSLSLSLKNRTDNLKNPVHNKLSILSLSLS